MRRAALDARLTLETLARPAGDFDASRYFRGSHNLGFFNAGSAQVRALARTIAREHPDWTVDDAMAFAAILVFDRVLEVKGLGVEVVARYHRTFRPALLRRWKQWLSLDDTANWATTDAICGMLIGPLLLARPALVRHLRAWSRDRSLWVRRSSVVGLIPLVRRGLQLDVAYANARQLHADREDLIEKAVGWMLREAGKADPLRLERYLRASGPDIPRTTVRYAIERFTPAKRKALLAATRRAPG